MFVWSSRTRGYKVGILLLSLGFAMYVVGFSAPFWIQHDSLSYSGLFMFCVGYSSGVQECDAAFPGGWWKTMQAMEIAGFLGILFGAGFAVFFNCCRTYISHNRNVESMCGVSGLFGFVGCIIFVGETQGYDIPRGWAFALNLAGSILLVITAFVIFAFNKKVSATPATDGATLGPYTVGFPAQGVNMGAMQPAQGYPAPPSHSLALAQPTEQGRSSVTQSGTAPSLVDGYATTSYSI